MSALHRTEWRAVGTTCAAAVTAEPHDETRGAAGARRRAGGGRSLRARALPFRPRQRPLPPQRSRRPVDARSAAGCSRRSALRSARARRRTGASTPPCSPRSPPPATTAPSSCSRSERPGGRMTGAPARRSRSTRGTAVARLEPGSSVDLGGIGKGYAAGRALDAMLVASPTIAGGLVDLGGDIAVRGESPEGGPWRVAVADPRRAGETLAVLALDSGGIATSGRDARRFGPGSLAPPPDRPGDRRVGARRAAHRDRRRAGPRRRRSPCDDARDRGAGRSRGARLRKAADLRPLRPARRAGRSRSARCRSRPSGSS